MTKKQTLGFGFLPEETQHHFLIRIPKDKSTNVVVYERFSWDGDGAEKTDIDEKHLKVLISFEKWNAVKAVIEKEFNRRLQINNSSVGKFKIGDTPLERLFGKELVLLLWAIEDSDPTLITTAIKNWFGLSMEERWWLFTMANASTGHYAKKRGWRIAIRYALTDNPVDEKGVQGNLIEYLYRNL